jgi:hypothetical protein
MEIITGFYFLAGIFFLNIQRSIEYAQEQFDIVGSSIAPFDNFAFLIFISINIKTDENKRLNHFSSSIIK